MEKQLLSIKGIPAIVWGNKSKYLFIAVHGDQSSKEDIVIRRFAEAAVSKGYQVLSFDLPEHGDRKKETRLCNAQNCVEDLKQILKYAHSYTEKISLFGCSIGAYFSMLAYKDVKVQQALFLSPVVNMQRIIENMMDGFNISKERLQNEQKIPTPIKTLYWDYYEYVFNHPVEWNQPTALLYGAKDNLCELNDVKDFANRFKAKITVVEDGEHFFYTQKHLDCYSKWLEDNIIQLL